MSPDRVAEVRTRIFLNLFIYFRGRLPNLNRNRHDGWAGLLQTHYPIAGQLSPSFPTVRWQERQIGGGRRTGGVEVGRVIQGSGSGGYLIRGTTCLKLLMSMFKGDGLLNTGVSLGTIARLRDCQGVRREKKQVAKSTKIPTLSLFHHSQFHFHALDRLFLF